MNAIGYLTMQAEGIPAAVRRRIDDLDEDQLVWRPTPRATHIGFIMWHCLRACDWQLGRVRGVTSDDEVWQTDGFRERTGYDPRGLGTRALGIGTGFTLAMVDAVPVTKELLASYADAISRAYVTQLSTMEDADLDTPLPSPAGGAPLQAVNALEVAMRQFYQHMGECDFLRGLIGIPDPTMPQEE